MAQAKTTASREAAKRKPVKSKAPVKRATARKSASNGIGPRKKPTISAVHFIGELARKLAETQSVQAIYDGRLDEGFREELMVAVAFQNQAPYCNWGHRTWASLAGVSDEELSKVEELSLENLDPKVSTAVTYVRALVSSDWEDAPRELRQQMQEYFTWREIEDIELIARAMDLSNRSANTWDAMLSRLQGKTVEDSDILSEIFFSSLFLSIIPNRLRKVSRLTDVSVLDAARGLLEHVKEFNQQKSSVA